MTTPTTVTPTPPPTTPPPPPPPASGTTNKLAAACIGDSDCGQGLTCLTAAGNSWLGGGAAHGYCTADCASGGASLCEALTPGAACVATTGGSSFCLLGCNAGTANNPKCQGREDVACDMVALSSSTGESFCRPMCRSDDDCGGRKCLLGSGICVDELPGNDAIGVSCDPSAAENSCASGNCAAGITDGTQLDGYCSGMCTFGFGGCGSTSVMPAKAGDASCFPAFSGSGRGDVGLCMQTCNCDADCDADKYVCAQFPDAKEALGVEGFCFEFDLEIPAESDVVLGVECIARDGGGDAMSHAEAGPVDASGPDAADADAIAVTSEPSSDNDAALVAPADAALDAALDATLDPQ